MDLDRVQETILASIADDWELWGTELPTEERHSNHATYRPDVALELRWGRLEDPDFSAPWTSKFTNSGGRSFQVEATYGGSMVLQEMLVAVDGGRYTLPLPRIGKPHGSTTVEYRVDQRRLAVARLLHLLSGVVGYDLDEGIRTAGFIFE